MYSRAGGLFTLRMDSKPQRDRCLEIESPHDPLRVQGCDSEAAAVAADLQVAGAALKSAAFNFDM